MCISFAEIQKEGVLLIWCADMGTLYLQYILTKRGSSEQSKNHVTLLFWRSSESELNHFRSANAKLVRRRRNDIAQITEETGSGSRVFIIPGNKQ